MSQVCRPRTLRTWVGAGLASAACIGTTHPVLAAEAETAEPRTGELVIVTGQKVAPNPHADPNAPYRAVTSASTLLTQPLNDTPKAITVITDATLEDMGVTTLRDLFRTQPGITLGTGEGGNAFGDRIFIRGFDARNDVFIDGVRDPGVGSREVFAVQQIEILKGPSSTFGGRGTTGGAISLISKVPGPIDRTSLELTLGTEETRRLTADVNYHINDALGIRVNLMAQDGGVAGRDFVYNKRWGGALSVAWQPLEPLKLGFDYYHLTTDYLPDWGLPWDQANGRVFDVPRSNFYGVLARDEGKTFSDVYTARADWQINENLKLHTMVRYGNSGNAYTGSAPEQPNVALGTVRANAKRRDAVTDYGSVQSNLTWDFKTGSIEHTLVSGIELSRETTLNRQRAFTECFTLPCTGLNTNPTLNLVKPDARTPWGKATEVIARPEITVDTRAIYAIDSIKLSDHWLAMIGVRADSYEAKTKGLTPNRETQSDFFNWHTGLVYKPIQNVSLYVSYGSASNPPCEQLDAFALDYGGCDARVVALDPVRNTTWELGAKINLFGHLDVNGAFFGVTREGVAIQVGTGPTATIGTQDQEVLGTEVTVAGNVTKNWSLAGGFTMFDAKIVNSAVPSQNGSAFPNVSEMTFTLTSRHTITDKLHLGATYVAQGEKFGGTLIAGSTRLPGFERLDLFGGYKLRDDIEIRFNLLNVTDETYYDALYRSATPFTYVAPGRSAQVTVDWHF